MSEPEPLQQTGRTYVCFQGRRLSYFSGCDYFRLASHSRVVGALTEGVAKYGLNVAASRLTTGNHALYGALESALAGFFAAQDALLVPNGYETNLVVAQALAGNFSQALIDRRSHPSLADAARWLDCPVLQFKHRDAQDLAKAVRHCGPGAKLLVLTDGMFAHDGSVAPLKDYLRVLPKDALLLVDDAHGAGILGPTGKGSLEHCGVSRRRIIQTITLSKAFGVYGGAILGAPALRRRILERSRMFIGNTPLPLPLANAALQAVRILRTDKGMRQRLREKTRYVKKALSDAVLLVEETPGPIIAMVPRKTSAVARLKKTLLAAGIYPPFIQYPGGPEGGYFRFALSSEHTRAQLDALLAVLCQAGESTSLRSESATGK